jgi:hypothetical protein
MSIGGADFLDFKFLLSRRRERRERRSGVGDLVVELLFIVYVLDGGRGLSIAPKGRGRCNEFVSGICVTMSRNCFILERIEHLIGLLNNQISLLLLLLLLFGLGLTLRLVHDFVVAYTFSTTLFVYLSYRIFIGICL